MESKYCLRRGEEADYADLIDFGNYVFQIDFRALLPNCMAIIPNFRQIMFW